MSVDSGEGALGAPGSPGAARLPEGWARVKLADILISPTANGRSVRSDDDGFPVLRLTALKDDGVDCNEYKLGDWTAEEAAPYLIRPGDFLVSRASGSLRLVGRGALVTSVMEPVAYPDTMIRIRTSPEHIEPRFLAHLWASPTVRRQIERSARTGTGINKVSQSAVQEVDLPLPPTAEQRRIADALEERLARLDKVEAHLRATLAHFDALWQAVLDGAATGALGDVQAPAERLVQEVADVRGGIQKQSRRQPDENAYPFLRVANVGRGTLDLEDVHEIELFGNEIDRYRLEEGDLLVVEGNGSPDQIGRAATWDGSIEDCVHQNHLIRVRPGPELLPAYLNLVWNSPTVAQRLRRAASSTSGLHTLSTRKLKELVIPVAALPDQDSLVEAANRAYARIVAGRHRANDGLAHTTALRHALLAEAFAGRLVNQDSDDEPAEDLLKRIRAEREAAEAERKAARRAAAQAKRKNQAKPKVPAPADAPPPPAPTTDTPLPEGEQTTLPLEFTA
ncbi:restriction endonuclease subunit S [Streptomyces sp. NPDC005407]|uniref:restriction endonuclease subunit S n=1 Tax=Streptomyces sp. NPDC005407 TaxID=3155340 RepID=UPI0033BC6C0C